MSRMPMNLLSRRRDEERRAVADATVAETVRVGGYVDFEHRTDSAIQRRLVRQRITERNKAIKAQLESRRTKLAALLEAERAEQEREIVASFESPEIVKERMFAHARKLKEEREASRRRLAEELEALRFRLGSDVFRARQSAITTERTALDRILQLQEKAALTALEAEREKEETAQMTARMAAGYDRERIEAEAKRRLQQELRTTWSQQTAVRGDLRSAERRVESEEERRMLEADRAAAEEQRRAAEARRTGAVEEYRKTQAYNATVKAQRDAASKAVFDAEVADLEATLKREADEDAAEKAAAMARKREAAAFKKQLEEQMAIQSEDASWMDKFYTAEADKEWAKRQAKWDAEAAARAALNAEVAATREMQLKERDRHKSLEAASDARQMQAWHEARAAAEAKERAAAERRQQQLDLQRGYTEQQMAERARAREAERQAAYLEWRLQQKQEKEYQSKVDALLREMPAETTHTRKKTGLW